MAITDNIPHIRKKHGAAFPEDRIREKHQRIAHDSLRNLVMFHATLEEEMQHMLAQVKQGIPLDAPLFEKMLKVEETYVQMMRGLKEFEYERESHALIIFADAVQDLLAHMHKKRRH